MGKYDGILSDFDGILIVTLNFWRNPIRGSLISSVDFVGFRHRGTPILGNLQGESNVPRGICGTSGVDTDVDFDS